MSGCLPKGREGEEALGGQVTLLPHQRDPWPARRAGVTAASPEKWVAGLLRKTGSVTRLA